MCGNEDNGRSRREDLCPRADGQHGTGELIERRENRKMSEETKNKVIAKNKG